MIDLHIHSTASDGLLDAKKIFDNASARKLKAISITDHDTVDVAEEATELSKYYGIEFIPGIEISTNLGEIEIHILGYFIDHKNEDLLSLIEKFKKSRFDRGKKIVENLQKDGIDITFDEVLIKAGSGDNIGRPHIAEVLLEKGICRNTFDVYNNYLGNQNKKYVVAKYNLHPKEAIKIIKNAGGLSFLAHPGHLLRYDKIAITEVIRFGIDGLEVIHPSHSYEDYNYFIELARLNNKLVSGGSDCHGGRKKNGLITIGTEDVPLVFLEKMKNAMK